MLRTITSRMGAAFLAACCIAAVAASAAAASEVKEGTFKYNSGSTLWGEVECHTKLLISKKYPSDGPNEGGKETEKCVSVEPGGKLGGTYFKPGEEYHGYWESDFYYFVAASYPGGEASTKTPSSLTIKVAKNFKSFKVHATYPAEG